MKEQEIIRTRDGEKIYANVHLPNTSNGSTVVIGSEVGMLQEFYFGLALTLTYAGYTVYTFDYRGIGKSKPETLKNYQANLHQWGTLDLDAVILHAKNARTQRSLIYIGHGISGQIVGLAPASEYISHLVLIGSHLSITNNREIIRRIKSILLVPFLCQLLGYFPGRHLGYCSDLPKGVAMDWLKWNRESSGLFSFFSDKNYRKMEIPLLAYSFADDYLAPKKTVDQLVDRFPNSTITRRHLNPKSLGIRRIGHNGFFIRQMLWPCLIEWMEKREKLWIKSLNVKYEM